MVKRPTLDAFKVGARAETPSEERAGDALTKAKGGLPDGGRDERKVSTLRLSREAWRQLKTLSMDLETSEQKLLALAANLMFRAAGLPEIADEPYPEDELKAQARR